MSNVLAKESSLPLPDLSDIIFLLVLQFALFLKPDFLLSDGSTGWHLVTGNYILKNHMIPHNDIISYTFAAKAWVAYEWLADLFMAFLVKYGGLNLLNVVAGSTLALICLLLYQRCRKIGAHFLFVMALVSVGILASSVHWLARPHLFTLFGVYLFVSKLDDFYGSTISGIKLIALLCLYMLFWVNCHPGFLFGFVLLIIYLLCALVEYLADKASEPRKECLARLVTLATALGAVLSISFINPYGVSLYSYIFKYLKGTTILSQTVEFTSPIFHGGLQSTCLELLFALFLIGLSITKRRLSLPQLLSSLVFGYLSLSALRNIPLFVIVVLPVIAQLYSKTIFSPSDDPACVYASLITPVRSLLVYLENLNTEFTENELRCRMHIIPAATFAFLVFASLSGGRVLGQQIINSTFDAAHKPTTTLASINRLKLDPKQGFNYDNWGGYIAYELGIHVFIDDRADFYGERFYLEYTNVSRGLAGWAEFLKRRDIRWILMPNDSLLVVTLNESPDWKLADKDQAASLYVLNNKNN